MFKFEDMDEKLTYEQAVERLNELVQQIENPQVAPEGIMDMVKEAAALIQFCRNYLRTTQEEILDNIKN